METNKELRYYEAKKRVKEMKDFYVHLFTYIVVIGFFGLFKF